MAQHEQDKLELPDYLIKTTLGILLSSGVVVAPFAINNILQERYLLGVITLIVTAVCFVTAYYCSKGKYAIKLNLFGIAPIITLATAFAIHELGVIGSYWAYLAALSLYFVLPEKLARWANIFFLMVVIPIAWNALEFQIFIRFCVVLLGVSLHAAVGINIIVKLQQLLKKQATTDVLTGLYNRLMLQSTLEHAIHQHQREKNPASLIMLDIDYFKKINDQFGHAVGDEVLQSIAKVLKDAFRKTDKVFRVGGEEFIVLLNNTTEKTGLLVAENLRVKIEKMTHVYNCSVTVSIGFSGLRENISWEEWIKQCDDNLYRAKENGRNQIYSNI